MSDIETPEDETNSLRSTLEAELTRLRDTAHFLRHRLDTVQSLLDQETFELSHLPAKLPSGAKGSGARALLAELNLSETELTIGAFLKALNQYLVKQGLVDLNDLSIRPTPLLIKAFYLKQDTETIPYSRILLGLSALFV